MKKKRLKIKWLNVFKLIALILCVGLIVHDIYVITIYSYITNTPHAFTWFGLSVFTTALIIAITIYLDFKEQIKSIPSYLPKHAKDTSK